MTNSPLSQTLRRAVLAVLGGVLRIVGLVVAVPTTALAATQPPLSLPFASGENVRLVGGPHNTNGCNNTTLPCSTGHPWNSLDLYAASGIARAAGTGTVQLLHC